MNTPEETNNKAPDPLSIGNLGRKLTIQEVAEIFDVTSSAVERCPSRYGGVKVGRQRLFFENLVVETIRSYYTQQMSEVGAEISATEDGNSKLHGKYTSNPGKTIEGKKERYDPFNLLPENARY